jgi:DNA-binding PadR family transcriptional regulator
MNYTSDNTISRRMIKHFMDILILKCLKKQQQPVNGYEIIKYLHREFGILLSPGTVYSTIYSLERQGFIKGENDTSNRMYKLTSKGEEMINNTCKTVDQLQLLVCKIFSEA